MSRRICVITGTRADYGLLRWVMEAVRQTPALQLQVVATGTHLVAAFGHTADAIEADGFRIDRRVDVLLAADTPAAVSKAMGLAMIGFSDALEALKPDVVVVLGDRYEALCAVTAANVAQIPVAHIHGGELTLGAMDDAFRHAMTKMSHLHFVAAAPYRDRVLQLGESPARVYVVGGLGVDAVRRLELLSVEQLQQEIDLPRARRNFLITFHPETLADVPAATQLQELLDALGQCDDAALVFTYPNADPQGLSLIALIDQFVAAHPRARAFSSLGQLRYLSVMQHADVVVGNSSSGILEAPVLGVPVVNIGARQEGRLRTSGIVDCPPDREAIVAAIERTLVPTFAQAARDAGHPWGDGHAASRIAEVLAQADLEGIVRKRFFNWPVPT